MKKTEVDVEVFPNCIIVSIKNLDTGEKTTWEISHRINQLRDIRWFFRNYRDFLISFNGIHYDNCIILFLLKSTFKSREDCLAKTKQFSDMIINNSFWYHEQPEFKYHNQWTDVDTFLYWSQGLRQSKKISLKGLAVQLGYPVIQELPFPIDKILTDDEIDIVINYNREHDLNITERLFRVLEKDTKEFDLTATGTFEIRDFVSKKYNINAYSYDVPKIASEVLFLEYCEKTQQDPRTLRAYFKDVVKNRIKGFVKYLPLEPIEYVNFNDVYNQAKTPNSFKVDKIIIKNNTKLKLSYGIGGLHSVNDNEIHTANDEYCIITSDVASLYPTLIENYNCLPFPEVQEAYSDKKVQRFKHKKGTTENLFYKLILNSVSGHLDQEYSWLYYPQGAMKMRLMGQLILTKLIDLCIESSFQVISANTDGIEVRLKRSDLDIYYSLIKQVEEQFNLSFEHDFYKKIVYLNVNSYMAITESGKIKQKGDFVTNPSLGNSVDFLVIPKALNAYFQDSIPIDMFIKTNKQIYDFCASKKISKTFTVLHNGNKVQNLNRFYASKKGAYSYKRKGQSEHHVLKDSSVIIYNNHVEEFPNNIDYQFYISKTQKIIDMLQPKQLTLF